MHFQNENTLRGATLNLQMLYTARIRFLLLAARSPHRFAYVYMIETEWLLPAQF
jgi:hypothetical protein